MEIGFVANPRFVQMYAVLLDAEDTRDGVCDILYQLLHRGMGPAAKVAVIENCGVLELLEHHLSRGVPEYAEDDEGGAFPEKLGMLLNRCVRRPRYLLLLKCIITFSVAKYCTRVH